MRADWISDACSPVLPCTFSKLDDVHAQSGMTSMIPDKKRPGEGPGLSILDWRVIWVYLRAPSVGNRECADHTVIAEITAACIFAAPITHVECEVFGNRLGDTDVPVGKAR